MSGCGIGIGGGVRGGGRWRLGGRRLVPVIWVVSKVRLGGLLGGKGFIYYPGEMSIEVDHRVSMAGDPIHDGENVARDVAEGFLACVGVFDHGPLK